MPRRSLLLGSDSFEFSLHRRSYLSICGGRRCWRRCHHWFANCSGFMADILYCRLSASERSVSSIRMNSPAEACSLVLWLWSRLLGSPTFAASHPFCKRIPDNVVASYRLPFADGIVHQLYLNLRMGCDSLTECSITHYLSNCTMLTQPKL